jgi:hypothetical protein
MAKVSSIFMQMEQIMKESSEMERDKDMERNGIKKEI